MIRLRWAARAAMAIRPSRKNSRLFFNSLLVVVLGACGGDPSPTDGPCPSSPRDPAFWPFESKDPWNTPIGSGAVYADPASPSFESNAGAALNCETWSHPIYIAKSSDPVRTFYRDGNVCAQVRVPEGAVPDPESDAHLHVIDEKHEKVVETWSCSAQADGNYSAEACAVNELRGPGVYPNWHGVRAYGGSAIAGLIRKGELKSFIPHVLAVAVKARALNKNGADGKPWVWPASAADSSAPTAYADSGNLFMGTLLAIPPSQKLDGLGLGSAGLELGRAMQDYGVYITDIADVNMAYYAEPAAAGDIPAGGLNQDLGKLTALLKVVTNNTASSVGGGGTRRRCAAPPFVQ